MGAGLGPTGDDMATNIFDAALIANLDAACLREHAAEMRAEAEASLAKFRAAPEADPTGRYVELCQETLVIVARIEARAVALESVGL